MVNRSGWGSCEIAPLTAVVTVDPPVEYSLIAAKRHQQKLVCFLTREEIDALLSAPDNSTWFDRRDQALLTLAVQTGLRVSELTRLVRHDIHLGAGPYARCHGKGRKDRATPLSAHTVTALTTWLHEYNCGPTDPVYPTRRGRPLSTDAVAWVLTKHAATAARHCPSLNDKHLAPHVLRHTAAMQLLHSGVDISAIALWLGRESVETTQIDPHADLALKEKALARIAPPSTQPGRYHPPDALLAFLEAI